MLGQEERFNLPDVYGKKAEICWELSYCAESCLLAEREIQTATKDQRLEQYKRAYEQY